MKLLTLNCHSWQEDNQIEKIKYFDSYPFVYQELSHTDQFAWIVYGGVEHSIGEIDNIFS